MADSTARAQSSDFLSEASSPASMDEGSQQLKRHRQSSEEGRYKRLRSDLEDDEENDESDDPQELKQSDLSDAGDDHPLTSHVDHAEEEYDENARDEQEETKDDLDHEYNEGNSNHKDISANDPLHDNSSTIDRSKHPPKHANLEGKDDEEEDERDTEKDNSKADDTQKDDAAVDAMDNTASMPAVKAEPEEGERLLNEEAMNVNGLFHAKDGVLDGDGNLKILDEYKAYEKKESAAMLEERNGEIEIRVVSNDGDAESMILLTGLKNIFQKQLPMMPKEYIARLVYDRNHCSIALIKHPMKVIGGICYRPFDAQEFAEIVFCAIASTEQVRGYGSHLMNHLKDYILTHTNMKHFLTYADNYAIGYFKKQGFTTEITLDKRKWVGYIKDYEGGTIMQCTMVPKVKYLQVHKILAIQRRAVYEKMKQFSTSHIVYPGIQMSIDEDGNKRIDPLQVPGVKESGWTPEMDQLSNRPRHPPHYNQMRHLVTELRGNAHSWPFHDPVNADEVTDYYDVIKEPMDLATLEQNVENDYYQTMDQFVRDVQKIFDNCRLYNAESTNYARCANRLERYFNERLRVWTSGDS